MVAETRAVTICVVISREDRGVLHPLACLLIAHQLISVVSNETQGGFALHIAYVYCLCGSFVAWLSMLVGLFLVCIAFRRYDTITRTSAWYVRFVGTLEHMPGTYVHFLSFCL